MGYKVLTNEEYDQFQKDMNLASDNLSTKDEQERQILDKMERDFQTLCVTGVEDLLQNGVRETIFTLTEANIKVWMLTGDKLETAKCIAISTGFKKSN